MKKELSLLVFTVILVACVAVLPFIQSEGVQEDFVIIIDAGHGGDDGGAVSIGGICEKDLNLAMSKSLSSNLEAMGYHVIMTRTDDTDTDGEEGFNKRKDILNRLKYTEQYPNSLFISVHMNSSTSSTDKGFTVFYGEKNELSKKIAENIYYAVENFAYTSRLRDVKEAPDSVYLMNNCTVPAILVECGFISNKTDEALLMDEKYREDLSYILACGIDKFCIENNYT
ncbi:MAG: N-acetylmuramoyl-L-alanine amidase [Clostridiales bacterium]|nr:N-acetylmuramoyl-L-alanine amidase [Clostridiales bacterium]